MTIKNSNILFLLLILFLLCCLALYPQVISDWRSYSFDDGTYSHAYLMPLIIGYLLWQQRTSLQLRVSYTFLLLATLCGAALAVSLIAQLTSIGRLLFPLYIILLSCSLLKPSKALIVPLALTWFVTPVWGSLIEPLQAIAVFLTRFFMQFTNIPVYVEGNFVQIPQGVFEIAEGCSGLRYFIVSLALSTLLCHLQLRKLHNMVLVILCAVLGAILVNGIRIVLIILIGYFSGMQSSIVHDHNMFGWFLYIPFIFALFYLVGKLEPHHIEPVPASRQQTLPAAGTAVVLLVMLCLSGASIRLALQQSPLFDYAALVINTPPAPTNAPQIISYRQKEQRQLDSAGIPIDYHYYRFNGNNDAERPDYYLNKLVPENWQVVKREMSSGSRLLWLRNAMGQHALLRYAYEANGVRTGSVSTYKLNRLRQAAKLSADSALHWQFVLCQHQHCAQAQAALQLVAL